MIREFQKSDIERLADIWLDCGIVKYYTKLLK